MNIDLGNIFIIAWISFLRKFEIKMKVNKIFYLHTTLFHVMSFCQNIEGFTEKVLKKVEQIFRKKNFFWLSFLTYIMICTYKIQKIISSAFSVLRNNKIYIFIGKIRVLLKKYESCLNDLIKCMGYAICFICYMNFRKLIYYILNRK